MKKFIIGSTLGIVLGAGAFVGLAQIPNVRDLVLIQDTTTTSSTEVNELRQENSTLKTQVDMLNADLTTTKTKLTDTESALAVKEQEVSTLTAEKADLQSQLDEALAENERLEGLVGSDTSQLLDTITSLTSQLNTKTEELNTATAELEQLRTDYSTLTTRVSELETRLQETEEELANYKSLEDIDILNTANYEGTWYKDSKFEDTYHITDGNVVYNQNEDTGYLICMYNQMYLSMITGGYIPVTLSVDGNSFTTEDGTTYSKFYINTTTSTLPTYADFVGTYNHDTESITLNVDNTLSMTDGEETYYGAYTVTAEEKNVGGNIQTTNYITATINVGDSQVVRNFEIISNSTELIGDELLYTRTSVSTTLCVGGVSSSILNNNYGYFRLVLTSSKPIKITDGCSISLKAIIYSSGTNAASVNNSYVSVSNGTACYTFSLTYSGDVNDYVSNFEFYFAASNPNVRFIDIVSINGYDFAFKEKEVLTSTYLNEYGIGNIYNADCLSSNSYISCSTIEDYTNGSYTLENGALELTSDGATITPTDSEAITATSYTVTAKTDGYDIYQTATITYVTTELVEEVETEVTHTIVIEYKNNNVISSTLDSVETTITKN